MMVLTGADVVLPDGVMKAATLVLDGPSIAAIEPAGRAVPAGAERLDASGCTIVPGFVDVHVHGVEGVDVLDGADSVADVAARLPRYGVTAFCPTSVACEPSTLERFLAAVGRAQAGRAESAARVVSAHLESNFINPDYKGAQPRACLRAPREPSVPAAPGEAAFAGGDVLDVIDAHRGAVGIVTLAPELEGGLDLVRRLTRAGHIVSIGHSGATYEQACEAIAAGVRHATHLFNRMSPMSHRAPGVPGAVLTSRDVCAEIICDGYHVHPALLQVAIRAKGIDRMMAITDGTAGSGLPVGATARLGSQVIRVTARTAELADGTLAGSVLTMDGAFRRLVREVGVSVVDAAHLCATTPAAQMGLRSTGRIAVGADADLAVLDGEGRVRHTIVRGRPWRNPPDRLNV